MVAPDEGTVSIGHLRVNGPGVNLAPEDRSLGMVFQDYALWPHLRVRDQVAFPMRMQRWKAADIGSSVEHLLRQMDLEGHADRLPAELSGGQQQRVGLARALASSPTALLLDEPLSNLDAQLRGQLRDELRLVCKTTGVACLYVTHDQSEALALSDPIAVMVEGRILQTGAPHDLFRRPDSAAWRGSWELAKSFAAAWRASVSGLVRCRTAAWAHGIRRSKTARSPPW